MQPPSPCPALQGEGGFGKEISPIALPALDSTVPRSPQRQGWRDLCLTTPADCFLLPAARAAARPRSCSGAEVCVAPAQRCLIQSRFQALTSPYPRVLLGPGCTAGVDGFWQAAERVPQLLARVLSTKGTSDVFLDTCCKGKCPIHIGGLLGARGREAKALLEEATLPTPSKSICRSLLFSTRPRPMK